MSLFPIHVSSVSYVKSSQPVANTFFCRIYFYGIWLINMKFWPTGTSEQCSNTGQGLAQNRFNSSWHGFHKTFKASIWISSLCLYDTRLANGAPVFIFMLRISCSKVIQTLNVIYWMVSGENHRGRLNLSCSWNQFEITSASWHGVLSCWV